MARTFSAPRSAITADPKFARGLRVTWWYTFGGILFFELVLAFLWSVLLAWLAPSPASALLVIIGGLGWVLASILVLIDYRRCSISDDTMNWPRIWVALGVAAIFGIAMLWAWGLWSIAVLPVVQLLVMLQLPVGVRSRVVLAVTALLTGLVVIDGMALARNPDATFDLGSWWFTAIYMCLTPFMSVFSLWWWDLVVRLDQARAAEARLAATQERLRVATDVHDLQGHHLQVIALQLELAERLMPSEPAAALTQLREARRSVDAARQGTRDLAQPFRGVPLPDEIANAADLLRAAGAQVTVEVASDAALAPAEVFGPVIRETTTNVLKHGGGAWVRLRLIREGTGWCYEIVNDAGSVADAYGGAELSDVDTGEIGAQYAGGGGNGIAGMHRRLRDAGGSLQVNSAAGSFEVKAVTA